MGGCRLNGSFKEGEVSSEIIDFTCFAAEQIIFENPVAISCGFFSLLLDIQLRFSLYSTHPKASSYENQIPDLPF